MRLVRIVIFAVAGLSIGCDSAHQFYDRLTGAAEQPKQVTPEDFVQHQVQATDTPVFAPTVAPAVTPQPVEPKPAIDKAIASVVEHNGATTQPAGATTVPSGEDTSLASGQYLTLGGVIAEVNGTPIYINKVLSLVWPSLHNDARSMDADHFSLAAREEISKEIITLEADELLYAAAEQSLDSGDKKLVADLTTAYHQQLVTQAGGSLEVARRKAIANGDDFDQLVREQYRHYMIELYQQRKFGPLAEPSAQDMRVYYQQHHEEPFITDHSEAVFDLLAIDPAKMGADTPRKDRQIAFEKAKQAHDRAAAGETFSTLFQEFNTDPGLAALTNNTGNMGSFQRGAFKFKQIEDAIWPLSPGQVTDVIEIDGVLYISKLESRKVGVIRPFEDEEVQAKISEDMRRQRFASFYEAEQQRLLGESIRTTYQDMFATAVDMAMQSYQYWKK